MIEALPIIATGMQGVNLAVLVLVLYRVTTLEKDVKAVQDRLNDTREDVIGLKSISQR